MNSVDIRFALKPDLSEIVRIYNESIPGGLATADLYPVSVEQRLSWFEGHSQNKHPLWVIDQASGGLAAWASLRPFYGRPAYVQSCEVSIYVSQQSQSQGLGRALLSHVTKQAPLLGIHRLVGFIFAHNQASLALFEKQGFETWGLLPGLAVLKGRRRDLKILGRVVGED